MVRPRDGRMLLGVCRCIAERSGCSVLSVRLLYVVCTLATCVAPGLLAYLLLAVFIPGEKEFDWYEYGEDI